ncbi:Retrovirus-related Pol poly from transposon, partial [Paramuricea clavata]
LYNKTSREVIGMLKAHLAIPGITEMVSDNGPQFSSDELKKFSDDYEFPQLNGKAENSVKTVKRDVKETRFEENSEMDIDPMEHLSTEDKEEIIRQSTGPQPILLSQKESSTLGSHTNVRQRESQGLMECGDGPRKYM